MADGGGVAGVGGDRLCAGRPDDGAGDGRIGAGMDVLGARTSDEDYSEVLSSLKRPHLDYFKLFYADTAMFGTHLGIKCGLEFFGIDQVVFSTDCPFAPIKETFESIDPGAPAAAARSAAKPCATAHWAPAPPARTGLKGLLLGIGNGRQHLLEPGEQRLADGRAPPVGHVQRYGDAQEDRPEEQFEQPVCG